MKRIITLARSSFATSDITVNPLMNTNTQMQNRPQTFVSARNTNTRLHTRRCKIWAAGAHPKEGKKRVSLTSQAVIFCALTVTRLRPQGHLYGNEGHAEPLSPKSKEVETGPFDFIWICVRGHLRKPQSQRRWGRRARRKQQGSAGGSVSPNVPSC